MLSHGTLRDDLLDTFTDRCGHWLTGRTFGSEVQRHRLRHSEPVTILDLDMIRCGSFGSTSLELDERSLLRLYGITRRPRSPG